MPERLNGTVRTDASLLASGAPDAFVEVCRRHGPALRSFLRRRTRDGDVAAELLAETLAAAWTQRTRFKDRCDGSAAPWLFAIARNQASLHARRGSLARSARERIGMPIRDYGATAYDEAEERLDGELLAPQLDQALADLSCPRPPRSRAARRGGALLRGDRRSARDHSRRSPHARLSRALGAARLPERFLMPTQIPPDLEAILSDLDAAVAAQAAAAPSRRRAHRPRRLALAAPLARRDGGCALRGPRRRQRAARVRRAAAPGRGALVAGEPAPVIGPGRYWYVKGRGAFANESRGSGGSFAALQTSSHEIWIAADASGRIVREDGPPQFFSAAERARWEAAGKPGFGQGSGIDETLAGGRAVLGHRAPRPHGRRDPLRPRGAGAARRAALRREQELARPRGVQADRERVALRPALGRADRGVLPGAGGASRASRSSATAKDGLGRTGTAFAVGNGGPTRQELILDPDTGRLLGSRTTLTAPDPVNPGTPVGAVIGSETIVATGVVGSTDARP